MSDFRLRGGDNVKIKVIKRFYDVENALKLRLPGDVLTVTDERGRELITKGLAAEEKEPEKPKTTEKTN